MIGQVVRRAPTQRLGTVTEGHKCEWDLGNAPFPNMAFALVRAVVELVGEQLPDLADMFPFADRFEADGFIADNWLCIRIRDQRGPGPPRIGELKEHEREMLKRIIEPFAPRGHRQLASLLGSDWFSPRMFTYVGAYDAPRACWQDAHTHLVDWLNAYAVPGVVRENQARVMRAIPQPPQIDLASVQSALWVLESEAEMIQGTAFALEGVGLVTCAHVLTEDLKAFRPGAQSTRHSVACRAANETIDLAVLDIDTHVDRFLARGSAQTLKQMDHIAVAGFPNYQVGDTGVIIPGLITGFRVISGTRTILTNSPIVAGMSGGPAIGAGNTVVGVVVTGAERVESAHLTEKHGVIPVDALDHVVI